MSDVSALLDEGEVGGAAIAGVGAQVFAAPPSR
jgi:hypothetical protein